MKQCLFVYMLLMLLIVGCQMETAVSPQPSEPQGRLVFIEVAGADQFVSVYHFATKTVEQIFTADPTGFISQIAVSPDQTQLLLAYAEPPPEGQIQFGYTNLFLTELNDTAVLAPLTQIQTEGELFFNPTWSPDGTAVVYTHILPNLDAPSQFTIQLDQMTLADRQATPIAEDAIWPRFDATGQQLVYVSARADGLGNTLWRANADGTEPVALTSPDRFDVVDVPMFSPDGEMVYFTAVSPSQSSLQWWEWLFGVQIAAAHNIPSDWYRVATTGNGTPERITDIEEVGIYGDFSPDGQFVGFTSFNGLYVMRPDGTELTQILEIGATTSLAWIGE